MREPDKEVLRYLSETGREINSLLDIPSGDSEFIAEVKKQYPSALVAGGDVNPHGENAICLDATRPLPIRKEIKLDAITSINGVMEFDNTIGFVKSCAEHLNKDGLLIITNDNISTIRDRLSFLFTGRVRRFDLFMSARQPTYKSIPIQELHKIFQECGIKMTKVRYFSIIAEDFFFVPFAVIIYPVQLLYMLFTKRNVSLKTKFTLFPFKSVIARRYFIAGQKV